MPKKGLSTRGVASPLVRHYTNGDIMLTKWLINYLSIEGTLARHPKFSDAFKIEGIVMSGDKTTFIEGIEASYSKAVLILCVHDHQERYSVWESKEYRYYTDALNVLKAECCRLSELINKRIEVIGSLEDTHRDGLLEVYNENNQQYILESTNL